MAINDDEFKKQWEKWAEVDDTKADLCEADAITYMHWLIENGFMEHVKRILRSVLRKIEHAKRDN